MTTSSASKQAGFTLIETLVALMLVLIGLAAVTKGFVEGHRLAAEAGQRQRAISLAQEKLAERLAQPYDAVATPITNAERAISGGMIGEDEVNGVLRVWVVETDHPASGLARVWVATRWVQREAPQTYQTAGLLANGLSP